MITRGPLASSIRGWFYSIYWFTAEVSSCFLSSEVGQSLGMVADFALASPRCPPSSTAPCRPVWWVAPTRIVYAYNVDDILIRLPFLSEMTVMVVSQQLPLWFNSCDRKCVPVRSDAVATPAYVWLFDCSRQLISFSFASDYWLYFLQPLSPPEVFLWLEI